MSKISGKGCYVVFNEEDRFVNAVTVVCDTENMDTDV